MKGKSLVLATLSGLLGACVSGNGSLDEKSLAGEWHEIMPVNMHIMQGMRLEKDGMASSVGMATLKYNGWKLINDENGGYDIVLSGESIGNGQTIAFSDTLDLLSLENDTLVLGKGGMYRIQYVRYNGQQNVIGGDDAGMGLSYSKVLSATDPQATMAAYIVFSQDSARAELFLPGGTAVLDRRTRPDGTYVWNVEDDDTYMVSRCEGEWMVSRRGRILYLSSGTENMIKAVFADGKGNDINVSFFTKAGLAQLYSEGVYNILAQYRTASGYGYSNHAWDMRGKGKEMTLTNIASGRQVQYIEK